MKKGLIIIILFILISSVSYVHAQRGFLFFDGSNLQKVVSTWNIDWGSGNVTTTGAFTGSSITVSSAAKAFIHLTNRLAFAPQNNAIFFIDDDSGNNIVKLYSETTRDLWLASTKTPGYVYTEDTFSCWSDNSCDLGLSTKEWKDLYVDGIAYIDSFSGGIFTGVLDAGGTTSTEIHNNAGDLTLNAAGEVGVDSTQRQLAWYDGTAEIAIPYLKTAQLCADLASLWDVDNDLKLMELDSAQFPDGIVITKWEVEASVADPTTELNANFNYCDDQGTGAFPGANATLIDVLDSTTGNSSESDMTNSDLGSGAIPAGKTIYLDVDVDPADANTMWCFRYNFYIPES